jgi:hypothetical protein
VGNSELDLTQRSKSRRNIIGSSPHREDYHRLLAAGWSSYSLEKYAMNRFGEDIPARTFRLYKKRKGIVAPADPLKEISLDDIPDVLQERIRILLLQKARIAIDAEHERNMNKLFGGLGREIELYSKLLTELRSDLQEVGLLARDGESSTLPNEARDAGPRYRTLGEAFNATGAQESELGKVLHLFMQNGHAQTNGKAV